MCRETEVMKQLLLHHRALSPAYNHGDLELKPFDNPWPRSGRNKGPPLFQSHKSCHNPLVPLLPSHGRLKEGRKELLGKVKAN